MSREPNLFRLTFNSIVSIVMLIGFLVLLFFIARGIFQILAWAAPFLILAALIINYRTVTGFLQYLWRLLTERPVAGIVAILLTVIGFPVVSGFLFGKALLDRKVRSIMESREPREEYIAYEDVTDQEEPLELRRLQKDEEVRKNPYSDYLDED